MGQDERRSPFSKLALKFGTVATAAAALLAEGNASADQSDVLKGLLDRNKARSRRFRRESGDGWFSSAPSPEAEQCGARLVACRAQVTLVASVAQFAPLAHLREQSLLALFEFGRHKFSARATAQEGRFTTRRS